MAAPSGGTWTDLITRTGKRTLEHDALGLSAQLAFYFFLAVFPAFLFLLALASFFPLQQFTETVTRSIAGFAPPEMVELLRQQFNDLSDRRDTGLLSLGLLTALWSSSAALVAVIQALNRTYEIEESRPFWKARLLAIGLTIGLAFFILVSFTLVIAGPLLARTIAEQAQLGAAFTWTWNILQWPVVFLLVALGISLVYRFAPNRSLAWRDVVPGAIVATVVWLVASLGFRFYVVNFGDYQEMYGAIGAVILLMLWFYISGLAMLIGAELNAELERAPAGSRTVGSSEAVGFQTDRRTIAAPGGGAPAQARTSLVTTYRPSLTERAAGLFVWLVWPRARARE